ncbi:MAG: serine hydrolase domain-containing protein [Bacteroidota bacterium]
MPKIFTLFFALISIVTIAQNEKKANDSKYKILSDEIPVWLDEYDVPAVSVAIVDNGKIVYHQAFGLQSPEKPATNETLFLSASIAKPMTAEVFLRLASLGKVNLDEHMANHWLDPDIADDPRAKLLTPRHVLTHQTGFKNWRRMTDGKLRFERDPGTEMGYSGEGFLYLVRFLEGKLGKPFNQLAEEVLFEPEQIQNASYVYQKRFENKMAWAYFPDGNWRESRKVESAFGAGGLRITAEDYAKFILSILNEDRVTSKLRTEQFSISLNQFSHCQKKATTPDACPENAGFGLGWYVYGFEDETIIGHTGANMGERTLAVFSPKNKTGLVVMTNGANGNEVIYRIAENIGVHQGFIELEKPKKK